MYLPSKTSACPVRLESQYHAFSLSTVLQAQSRDPREGNVESWLAKKSDLSILLLIISPDLITVLYGMHKGHTLCSFSLGSNLSCSQFLTRYWTQTLFWTRNQHPSISANLANAKLLFLPSLTNYVFPSPSPSSLASSFTCNYSFLCLS